MNDVRNPANPGSGETGLRGPEQDCSDSLEEALFRRGIWFEGEPVEMKLRAVGESPRRRS